MGIVFVNGIFRHTLDQKNRIVIPSKLRSEIGYDVVVTLPTNGKDKCLYVYQYKKWLDVMAFCNETLSGEDRTVMQRKLGRNSDRATVDEKTGRLILASNLLNEAEIKENVVLIGAGERLEIWADDEWNKYLEAEAEAEKSGNIIKFSMPF